MYGSSSPRLYKDNLLLERNLNADVAEGEGAAGMDISELKVGNAAVVHIVGDEDIAGE